MTDYGSFSLGGNSSRTIRPGIDSSISVAGNAKLTMASGIYIIEGGGSRYRATPASPAPG